MYLSHIKIKNHPILKDIDISLINPRTNKPYSIVAFVGENGCGKTTLLNELFEYEFSKYIIEKEFDERLMIDRHDKFTVLYLKQGSIYSNAMSEIKALINDGGNYSPYRRDYSFREKDSYERKVETIINNKEDGLKLIELLGDKDICELFKEGHIKDAYCSSDVSQLISGQNRGYNITKYSSGQREIILKLRDLELMTSNTDFVLLDEPETSLHPRWQKDIVRLMRLLSKDVNGNYPQFFIATHSEKVLESLIGTEDTLIVGLSKDSGNISVKTIDEMDLRLPRATFAEVDYIVFNIPSLDYHDQLFTYFGQFFNKDSSTGIDLKVERIAQKVYGKAKVQEYEKGRTFTVRNKVYFTKMLPTYIRDFFHHPGEIVPPTEEELVKSIELLRKLIEYLKEKGEEVLEEADD